MAWVAKHSKDNFRRKKENPVCNTNTDKSDLNKKKLYPRRYYSKCQNQVEFILKLNTLLV